MLGCVWRWKEFLLESRRRRRSKRYTWEHQTYKVPCLLTYISTLLHVHFLVFSFSSSYSRLVFSYPNIHNFFLLLLLSFVRELSLYYPFSRLLFCLSFIENGEKRIHRDGFFISVLHWKSRISVTILQLRLKVETRVWSFRPLKVFFLNIRCASNEFSLDTRTKK